MSCDDRLPTILRDGIYELRIRAGRSQHRILYFFHGRDAIVLSHGLTKEGVVPPKDVERAVGRMRQFKKSPVKHTYREETTDG
jgi:phage-related protein